MLFHISENGQIDIFIPRPSKPIWGGKKYVWAIHNNKLNNYILPRDCPRICITGNEIQRFSNWVSSKSLIDKATLIFYPDFWQKRIDNCQLYRYAFNPKNFELIDTIAGYYVSTQIEIPIEKLVIDNCLAELEKRKVKTFALSQKVLFEIKAFTIANIEQFSIIKWDDLEK